MRRSPVRSLARHEFAQAIDDAGLPDDPELKSALKAYFHWATHAMSAYPDSPDDVQALTGLATTKVDAASREAELKDTLIRLDGEVAVASAELTAAFKPLLGCP